MLFRRLRTTFLVFLPFDRGRPAAGSAASPFASFTKGLLVLTAIMDTTLAVILVKPTPFTAGVFVILSTAISFAYFTASRTIILGICKPEQSATELSTFLCLGNGYVLALASLGNFLAAKLGTTILFMIAAAVSFAALVIVLRYGMAVLPGKTEEVTSAAVR